MLTDKAIKAIQPKEREVSYLDDDLLYLYVSPKGKKSWKVRYKTGNTHTTYKIGEYPQISLKEAREKRNDIKKQLLQGVTPQLAARQQQVLTEAAITFEQLINIYIESEVVKHRGAKWEKLRLEKFKRDNPRLIQKPITDVTKIDLARVRDNRLKQVSPDSARRELSIISSVFSHAVKTLHLLDKNPMADVRKPSASNHRDRRPSDDEINALLNSFGYFGDRQPLTHTEQAAWAFLFAMETAMRQGEIAGMRWEHVKENHIHLPITKNGQPRDVPLTPRAIELLELVKGIDPVSVLTVSAGVISCYFTRHVRQAGIDDLHFHDSRHEATSRLAKLVSNPVHLAKITGHRELKQLLTYFNPTADELAAQINNRQ